MLDRDERVVYCNALGETFLSTMGQDGILGEQVWNLLSNARGTVFEEQVRRASKEQIAVEFEYHSPTTSEWYGVRACPSDGVLLIFLKTITEERKLREGQKEGDKWFRTITENMAEGLGLVDAEGRNLYSNPANLRMHRYRDEEEARELIPRFAEVFEVFDLEGRRLPVEE
jgi:transcriptional regulator with PAS, ATPase and Fis domain